MGDRLRLARHVLAENPLNLVALLLLALLLGAALLGPLLVPFDPLATNTAIALRPPTATHWFGTDQLGRDIFSRVVVATRLDLAIAASAVLLSLLLGAVVGASMGYFGGKLDSSLGRVVDVLMAFPLFALAMAVVASLGNSVSSVVYATAVINLPFYIRLARAEVSVRRNLGYIEAARVGGSSHARILRVFLLPNIMAPLVVQASLNLGWAVLNAAGLSFIGLGVRAPTPEWGIMVAEGAQFIVSGQWWLTLFPGLALMLAVFCFNLLGDGLRDMLDPAEPHVTAPLLSVRDLSVQFRTRSGTVHALERVSFDIAPGEMLGIVGESGSGKSVTAYTLLGLLDSSARVTAGTAQFDGRDLLSLRQAALNELRGKEISIVFQNPRTALNPIRPVGQQIADVIARHDPGPTATIREKVLAALRQLRIPDPEGRLGAFPHELSGGMCQRIGIAMALACAPRLLLADEPTTGLDVTTQAVVMDLFREAIRARGVSAVLITHDLALASEHCDRIVVMHAGHVVEDAPVGVIFAAPRHPYTARLLASVPSAVESVDELQPIDGALPDLRREDLPFCRFAERCERRAAVCDSAPLQAVAISPGHRVACRLPL